MKTLVEMTSKEVRVAMQTATAEQVTAYAQELKAIRAAATKATRTYHQTWSAEDFAAQRVTANALVVANSNFDFIRRGYTDRTAR